MPTTQLPVRIQDLIVVGSVRTDETNGCTVLRVVGWVEGLQRARSRNQVSGTNGKKANTIQPESCGSTHTFPGGETRL